jgi:hypothetical protein
LRKQKRQLVSGADQEAVVNAAISNSRSPSTVALLGAVALLCAGGALAGVSDLAAFLQRAEKMAQINRTLRADVRMTRGDGSQDTAVILTDPARGAAFVAVKSDGFRALAPLDWKNGKASTKGGAVTTLGADDPLGALGLRVADLFPAWTHDYSTAFISDETPQEKTVTIYGTKEIPYSLFVITFDKERLVPVLTKYYRERLNNLVRLRKDESYAMVGARPRPQKITITDYEDNFTTTYDVTWSEVEALPAPLFDDAGFATATVPWRENAPAAN